MLGYNFTEEDFSSLGYHRIVEAFKFSYAQRMDLGDPDYNETINEVSTTNITVLRILYIQGDQVYDGSYYSRYNAF